MMSVKNNGLMLIEMYNSIQLSYINYCHYFIILKNIFVIRLRNLWLEIFFTRNSCLYFYIINNYIKLLIRVSIFFFLIKLQFIFEFLIKKKNWAKQGTIDKKKIS